MKTDTWGAASWLRVYTAVAGAFVAKRVNQGDFRGRMADRAGLLIAFQRLAVPGRGAGEQPLSLRWGGGNGFPIEVQDVPIVNVDSVPAVPPMTALNAPV